MERSSLVKVWGFKSPFFTRLSFTGLLWTCKRLTLILLHLTLNLDFVRGMKFSNTFWILQFPHKNWDKAMDSCFVESQGSSVLTNLLQLWKFQDFAYDDLNCHTTAEKLPHHNFTKAHGVTLSPYAERQLQVEGILRPRQWKTTLNMFLLWLIWKDGNKSETTSDATTISSGSLFIVYQTQICTIVTI